MLSCLMAELQNCLDNAGKRAYSDSYPATIPPAFNLLVSPYQPDIVGCNEELKIISLLELIWPFSSHADLTAAHHRKEGKPEYQQIVAELDYLGFVTQYYTVEMDIILMKPFGQWKKFQNYKLKKGTGIE